MWHQQFGQRPPPFVDSFHSMPLGEDESVNFYWVLPVYDEEANYALEHGPGGLMALFSAQGLDLTRMDRDEANTLMAPEDADHVARIRDAEEFGANTPPPARKEITQSTFKELKVSADAFAAFQADDGLVMRRPAENKSTGGSHNVLPRRPQIEHQDEPERPGPAPHRRKKKKKKKKIVRFALPEDRRRDPIPDADREPEPETVVEARLSPEEARKQRIEDLKAAAKARQAAARGEREDDQ